MNASFVSLSVADGPIMRAYVSRPAEIKGGLILFQEAYGLNEYIRRTADRFASEGYLVIAPELFHRTAAAGSEWGYDQFSIVAPHFQAVTEAGLEADAKAAYGWLVENDVSSNAVSTCGFCLGGRVAFLANSVLPLRRAVSFYGGGMHLLTARAPALHAPALLFWGGKDTHITSGHRQAVTNALDQAGKDYTEVIFADAGHGFFCDARSSYHKRSAELAWPLVVEFLK